MKKYLLSYCLFFGVIFAVAKTHVTLQVNYENPTEYHGTSHRSPIVPIHIVQEEHTFTFPTRYSGDIIEVIDGETLLHTSYILENGIIEIPSNISGNVEIRLLSGNRVYSGTIDL